MIISDIKTFWPLRQARTDQLIEAHEHDIVTNLTGTASSPISRARHRHQSHGHDIVAKPTSTTLSPIPRARHRHQYTIRKHKKYTRGEIGAGNVQTSEIVLARAIIIILLKQNNTKYLYNYIQIMLGNKLLIFW